MYLVKPSYEILYFPPEPEQMIERVARTCYKSEEKTTESSASRFVGMLKDRGHHAMLEFGGMPIVKLVCDRGVSHEVVRHRLFSLAQESTRYCVAGDMLLTVKNPHQQNLTVAKLYEKKQTSKNGAWKRIKIRQMDEETGLLQYGSSKDIFLVGERPVIKINTKLGYTISCTSDHRIHTSRGYRLAGELRVGDSISVNGTTKAYLNRDWLHDQYNNRMKTAIDIAKEFHFNVSTIKKWIKKHRLPSKPRSYWNKNRIPWNKGLTESDDQRVKNQADALRCYHNNLGRPYNVPSKRDRIKKLSQCTYHKTVADKCDICGISNNLLVHHIDNDRTNNQKTNLTTLCTSCHGQLHNKNVKTVFQDKIVSIEWVGIKEVYDIQMQSPNNNFIANGVVVHNCNYKRGVTFVIPGWITTLEEGNYIDESIGPVNNPIEAWLQAMLSAEKSYIELLNDFNWSPQQARSVLPNSLKTEIVCGGNTREWMHVFSQRCSPAAHPQMRELMVPLAREFASRCPTLFEEWANV